MKLIFASNNLHKLEEVRKILPAEVCVLSLNDIGFHHDIEETGTTLSENSRIKAEAVHEWLQHHPEVEWDGIFADDTGLEIAALNGAPGVYTARWAGEDCVAANNRAKALNELQGKTNRAARFRTVVTLIRGEKTEQPQPLILDFRAEPEQVKQVELNGQSVAYTVQAEHIVIAKEHISAGENRVRVHFTPA